MNKADQSMLEAMRQRDREVRRAETRKTLVVLSVVAFVVVMASAAYLLSA